MAAGRRSTTVPTPACRAEQERRRVQRRQQQRRRRQGSAGVRRGRAAEELRRGLVSCYYVVGARDLVHHAPEASGVGADVRGRQLPRRPGTTALLARGAEEAPRRRRRRRRCCWRRGQGRRDEDV